MTAVNVRWNGAWVPVGNVAGVSAHGVWIAPRKWNRAGSDDAWHDTGYVPSLGSELDPYLVRGDETFLEVGWLEPAGPFPPSSYEVSLYLQNGTKVKTLTKSTNQAPLTMLFGPVSRYASYTDVYPAPTGVVILPDTNYYITVKALSPDAASTSATLKVRTGHAAVTHQVPDYTYGTEGWSNPRPNPPGTATSTYGSYTAAQTLDTGTGLLPFSTVWASAAHTGPSNWEGIAFSVPVSNNRLTKVGVWCDPQHDVYLGIQKRDGTWLPGVSPVPLTSYSSLQHSYARSNTGRTSLDKTFDVSALGLKFSDIAQFNLAVTNQVPFPGGPTTSTVCNQGGSPVTTLGAKGTATDTCTGTVNETAPPCGSGTTFFPDKVAAFPRSHPHDPRDVAAVAAQVLLEPHGHDGETYELTGPEALNLHEIAAVLRATTGTGIHYVDTPLATVRDALSNSGMPQQMVTAFLELHSVMASSKRAPVTSHLRQVTGRPPRSFAGFAAEHAAAW